MAFNPLEQTGLPIDFSDGTEHRVGLLEQLIAALGGDPVRPSPPTTRARKPAHGGH